MNKSPPRASVDIEVPFHDVDMMQVVWHGHYSKYFELARCALLDKIDYNYLQMCDSGYIWPVVDLRIRYIKPARFGQLITVQAALAEWESRLKIDYLIVDKQTGVKLTKGYTVQVAVNIETQEMCFESPPVLSARLETAEA